LIPGGLTGYLAEKQLEQKSVSGSEDIDNIPSSERYLSESAFK